MSSAITGHMPGYGPARYQRFSRCGPLRRSPRVDGVVGRRLADIAAVLAVLTGPRACDLVVRLDVFFALCIVAWGHDGELPQRVDPNSYLSRVRPLGSGEEGGANDSWTSRRRSSGMRRYRQCTGRHGRSERQSVFRQAGSLRLRRAVHELRGPARRRPATTSRSTRSGVAPAVSRCSATGSRTSGRRSTPASG